MFLIAMIATAQLGWAAEAKSSVRKPASQFRRGRFTCSFVRADATTGNDGQGFGLVVESTCDVNKPFSVSISETRYAICCTGSDKMPN